MIAHLRVPGWLGKAARAAVLAVLLFGTVASALHRHASGVEDASCSICTLAHTAAITSPLAPTLAPAIATYERFASPAISAPAVPARRTAPARGPPRG